jgi:hypothetical protein
VADEMTNNTNFTSALGSHFLDGDNTIGITPKSVNELAAEVSAARTTAGTATEGTAGFHDVTEEEDTNEQALLASIRNLQTRAKGKYQESNPAKLKSYWVGERLNSRSQIEQAGAAIYSLLRTCDDQGKPVTPQDSLPGLTSTAIDNLGISLGSYTGVQTRQGKAQQDATSARQSLDEQCAQISRRRRKIQLAIDAEYPVSPDNGAFRKRFDLPTDRAMS